MDADARRSSRRMGGTWNTRALRLGLAVHYDCLCAARRLLPVQHHLIVHPILRVAWVLRSAHSGGRRRRTRLRGIVSSTSARCRMVRSHAHTWHPRLRSCSASHVAWLSGAAVDDEIIACSAHPVRYMTRSESHIGAFGWSHTHPRARARWTVRRGAHSPVSNESCLGRRAR
jgi:hypothetical protein